MLFNYNMYITFSYNKKFSFCQINMKNICKANCIASVKFFVVFSKGGIAVGKISGQSSLEMLPKWEISQSFSGVLPTSLTTGSEIFTVFRLSQVLQLSPYSTSSLSA